MSSITPPTLHRCARLWRIPMSRAPEPGGGHRPAAKPPAEPRTSAAAPPERAARVLVVDADAALLGLLAEWLKDSGCALVPASEAPEAAVRCDLVVAVISFPRRGGSEALRRIAAEQPATPIVALSSSFLPGIEARGAVARSLGVAAALPIPFTREALVEAVRASLRVPQ